MIIVPQDVHDFQGGAMLNVGKQSFADISKRYVQTMGVGTAYTLTTTPAAITFGTTSPTITLTEAGVWAIRASIQLDRAGMTITTQTASLVLRRTNNTAADLGSTVTIDLPASTTLTDTLGTYIIPEYVYSTTNAADAVTIFAAISASLGAGTLTAIALGTVITAVRIG